MDFTKKANFIDAMWGTRSLSKTKFEISDRKIRPLEIIQGIVKKVAAEGARMKRFALISGAAIMLTATATNTWYLVVVGIIIWNMLWGMDAKYLTQERQLSKMFDTVKQPEIPVDISPSLIAGIKQRNSLSNALLGWCIWPLYSSLIAISLIISIAVAMKVGSLTP